MKGRQRIYRSYMCDFETTVYNGQTETEVWAAAIVELGTEDVKVFNSISSFWAHVEELSKKNNLRLFWHNLKFDGSFLLDFFLREKQYKQAVYQTERGNPYTTRFYKETTMCNNMFKYMISEMGIWYSMTLRLHNHYVQIVDSYKLLPFSVDKIGKDFKTKHQKTSIEYSGYRKAGESITEEEKEYIRNDVLVVKEALEIMQGLGHTKMTIGSCCLQEYKNLVHGSGAMSFTELFPDLTKVVLDKSEYGSDNADAYIRKAYRGGWCYVARGNENRVFHNGITLDVNSLYPSVMSGESGNVYPYGYPVLWKGDYIPDKARDPSHYYYIRIRTRFKIREGFVPTIQIKNSLAYKRNEYLETSELHDGDIKIRKLELGGKVYDGRVELTLSKTDWQLMQKHYHLYETEILDGMYFQAKAGLFDVYINKYKELKQNSTGAVRSTAKLYLNNLYGRLATGTNSSYKYAYLRDDGQIGFITVPENAKRTVYIAAGAAVTAYAREFTITAFQNNYYGPHKPGAIYADTDSVHCDLPLEKVKGVRIDDREFLCWKHESSWDTGLFLRQKTYIEVSGNDANVTACGMGKRCKELVAAGITGTDPHVKNEQEADFMKRFHGMKDFKVGLAVPSNLKQKRMKGGVVLVEDYFQIN